MTTHTLCSRLDQSKARTLNLPNDHASLPVARRLCYTDSIMEFLLNVLAFPFRLIGKLVDVIGRVVVLVLGFVLMVIGVAMCIAPLFRIVGIPLFIVGLLLVLRSLA